MPTMPMRSEELQRPRSHAGQRRDPVTYGQLQPVAIDEYEPDPGWHPIARMMWDSALTSGQAGYYQNSDIALLYFACDELTRYRSGRISSMHLKEIMDMFSQLLVSEGRRRMARLELQRPQEEEASYLDIAAAEYGAVFAAQAPVSPKEIVVTM